MKYALRFALAFAIGLLAHSAEAKPRVASLNMCTDQLVLALADDVQILGLSALSSDPVLSYYRARARLFPKLSGLAEDAVILKPDVIVTASFAKPETRRLLAQSGRKVEAFSDARTIAEVKHQITRMGALLEQQARAAIAVAAIDAALAEIGLPGSILPLSLLPLERRGWITGRETLLTDVLRSAGYRNLGAEIVDYGGRMPLETLATLSPDRLLLTSEGAHAEDQGSALLQHPALARLRARGVLIIPERLTVCPGPMLAEALRLLKRQQPAR